MLTKAGLLIAWIALAACGGGTRSPAPPTPPGTGPAPAPVEEGTAEVSCQQAVDGLFAVTAVKEPPDLRARSSKVFVHRCETDRWSAEIKGCMAGVKVPADADGCERLLTPEQKRELADELSRELDAAGVKPEMESGKPKPKPEPEPKAAPKKAPKAAPNAKQGSAPGRTSDPCEGGE